MTGSCFTYDPHHWSIFFGLVGFGSGLAAVWQMYVDRARMRRRYATGELMLTGDDFAALAEMPGPSIWGPR